MFEVLRRTAYRKGLAAGLAALVAVAGIGVAVARPASPSEDTKVNTAFAIGATDDMGSLVDEVVGQIEEQQPGLSRAVDVDSEEQADEQVEPTATLTPTSTTTTVADSVSAPTFDPGQFLPEGGGFDLGQLEGLLPSDVADGAGALAGGVAARIQACVGDTFGDGGFDFGGFGGFGDVGGTDGPRFDLGAGPDGGTAFTAGIIEDVLPCVSGLVDDTLGCVRGLVEEILSSVMSFDIDQIMGLAKVIVDELVDCVGGSVPS